MACGGSDNSGLPLDELSNQFLICPLCLEQYTLPKVLPCQHTFCQDCIRSYVSARGLASTIPCPLCKELVHIPDNDVTKFKNNFMIVSLLQFVEKAAKTEATSGGKFTSTSIGDENGTSKDICGACGEATLMTTFCQLCQLWLCNICTKAHMRLTATADHQLLTSKQVDIHCKAMVGEGEAALSELQNTNSELYEAIVIQQAELPDNVRLVKERINTVAVQATKAITDKVDELNRQADQFLLEQTELLAQRSRAILRARGELDDIEELLKRVKVTEDGFNNQRAMKKVEDYISKKRPSELNTGVDVSLSLSFSTHDNNLSDLRLLDIGQMRVVSSKPSKVYLMDRPLTIHKISSLVEGDYITALAINKFADKFVAVNNKHIMVFKPDSRVPKPFLSPLSNTAGGEISKPWGIAYYEEAQAIFVSHSGEHEGNGGITVFSLEGHFQSHIASGLTLPRGIAIHKSYIFVCDQIDRCVYILTTSGRIVRVLRKTPDGKFLFNGPMFVSVGKSGLIAVSDDCSSVKIFDKDCILKYTYVSDYADSQFWDVHVMQSGAVVVCDWKHGMHKIAPDFNCNGLVTTEASILREPSAVAALEGGNVFYIGTCEGEIYTAI